LPEPADIIERVGKYSEEHVAKFNNNEQRELYWQLNYLLGRYRYRNGSYPEALALFDKVNRKSKYYVEAQFFAGISNVQMRRSSPAVQSFQRILGRDRGRRRPFRGRGALPRPGLPVDGSHLLLGEHQGRREHQPADRRPDAIERGRQVLEQGRRRERVLARRALRGVVGLLHGGRLQPRARQHPHDPGARTFPHAYYPEADVLKAVIYFSNCQYDDALTIVAKFRGQFQPIREELTQASWTASRRARTRKRNSTSS
jgi:tetratricopeptide (TPR) repeat protein